MKTSSKLEFRKAHSVFCIFCTLLAALVMAALLSVSVAAQSDVPRKTVAVTYPLGEEINVQFRGTTRFPRLRGSASVKRMNKSGTKVELSLDNMPRPYELGAAYTTFIVWAITPEGRVDNLAEIKRRTGTLFDTRIVATTPLQTFALIVTAEPHYLVKEPSKAVILENISPAGNVASVVNVQYFGNSSDYFRDPRVPEIAETDYVRTPVSLLGARQAINLAKYSGAERDATVEFEYAQKSLEQAENAWRGNQPEDQVDILSRQAIAAGARAEETAVIRKDAREKRNEAQRRDAEVRKAEDKADSAQRQLQELQDELNRERRARELSERDAGNYSKVITDLRSENQRLRDEISKLRGESEDAKLRLARMEGERQAIEAQRQTEERLQRIRDAQPVLKQSLKQFGAVRDNGRGIVLTIPELAFTNPREANLTAAADGRLQQLAQLLVNNPDYRMVIEAHTDDKGNPDELMALTQERAKTFADKLVSFGIPQSRLQANGAGATFPLVPNTTNANRAKNRRVEITLFVIENSNTDAQASQ
ncbi:MAG TPA: OmpA family protein [Pyrinomonadaceae bacterium]|jgi:outer membrane protein OmpA-like peptidoglycan-associated protein